MISRPSTAAPILAVLAVVLETVGAYVAGYFWLGKRSEAVKGEFGNYQYVQTRLFRYRWQAKVFGPISHVESVAAGERISVTWDYVP